MRIEERGAGVAAVTASGVTVAEVMKTLAEVRRREAAGALAGEIVRAIEGVPAGAGGIVVYVGPVKTTASRYGSLDSGAVFLVDGTDVGLGLAGMRRPEERARSEALAALKEGLRRFESPGAQARQEVPEGKVEAPRPSPDAVVFLDFSCPKCGRRYGWHGRLADLPAKDARRCPRCGGKEGRT